MTNGAFYMPVGDDNSGKLSAKGKDREFARELWEWTDGVLEPFL